MESEVQSALTPLSSGSDFDRQPANLNASTQIIPLARNALRASIMYLVVATLACAGELYLAIQSGAWQLYVLTGIGALITLLATVSVSLVRHGRPQAGVRLLIGVSLVAVLVTPLLLAGFGLILGLGTILIVLTIAPQTLPLKEGNLALMISVAVAIGAGGLDLWAPASQLTFPAFYLLILILGGGMILVSGMVTLRQFRAYPLTTKLILAFLGVSLLPLGLLALLNDRYTRTVLTEKAEQSLLAAASKTATDIDTFISVNLETVRTEANLPALSAYLALPIDQRKDNPVAAAAAATLRELSRKDKVFIASYALLDSQGHNLLDTDPTQMDQDESGRDYFQKPLETGLPYLSPVEFIPSVEQDSALALDNAALYFSSPVRAAASGEILGVLRVRYKAAILQQLVVKNNNLVGQQSFAILFDENDIRLAHGAAPHLMFQPIIPLDSEQLKALQAADRLPPQPDPQPVADLPDLAAALDNAIFEPFFTTRLEPTGDRVNLVAVKELEAQPWLVAFAQPQDLFLAPIEAQTSTTLFLAIGIAGVVAVVAFAVGQLLANPLVQLTEAVTRFTSGDLEARAQVKSGDESGKLAASFNNMAGEVGSLLKNLAERTGELEAEIGERRRTEVELQISEEKYRHLFEDSRDIIFISTPTGQLLDINPAGMSLFGYSRIEFEQMNAVDLYIDPLDRAHFRQMIEQYGAVRDYELKLVTKEGQVRDCLVTATIRYTDDGDILNYQGILRDITEQKRVERERLRLLAIERELTLAQEIQQSLLPPAHPAWNGPDVVCYSIPAREMGGDLYAYHVFDSSESSETTVDIPVGGGRSAVGGRYAIAVGDVSGKGMPAALLMAVSAASFQAIIGQGLAPKALLTHLDQAIALYTRTTGQNCALIYMEISLLPPGDKGGAMRVANAGCVMPLIRRMDGTVRWVEVFGTPLGMELSAEVGYREVEVSLSCGDLIILTSDGVIEATNVVNELFGFDRLEQAVATGPTTSAEAMLDHLKAEVAAFVGQTEPHDDMTIVVVQV